ncbi:Bystin-domain-containing protein [Gloeophyllum trabeum ATCC 11539]|uniref:Bystin-domain-containing protein n=1 Tax=Gloeophyllum trabeum (strain ATCC 11539 / FP-39264 / Madison 617) TaxID=670483 RepID=S7RXA3_GLOTA|nr:Bystin-domain-containing protein [Gloeophyllum trabeum ATCC 11539]EPQ59515.1 Bystin-domain-containing protein [Gloeophyllum trabeum ATCC 11539]
MPRASKASGKTRHDPLHIQLKEDELHEKYGSVSQPGRRKKGRKSGEDDENEEVLLDPRTSKRIFELARDQQEELQSSGDEDVSDEDDQSKPRPVQTYYDDEEEEEENAFSEMGADEAAQEFQIDSGDLQTLDTLLPTNVGERRTLADIIFSKLEGGITETVKIRYRPEDTGRPPDPAAGLDPKVVEVYTKIGIFLSRYRSGPLPKPFKVLPSLPAWARLLALTRPESWSPHACRAATRIFISTMKKDQAQLFLQVVLLDAVREDIRLNGKLNVHYYEALIRALYKPGAFFKAILFPLVESGSTLKEAAIVASVLAKAHIPVLPASGALIRLASMDYTGPNSLFIRVLLDKKHALPYKVLDALVFHFIRLSNTYKARTRGDSDKLPVLWHQSLLVFCQRYAADLSPDQKDALLDVVRVHFHPQIGPEVRRELVNSVSRGEPRPEDKDVEMG